LALGLWYSSPAQYWTAVINEFKYYYYVILGLLQLFIVMVYLKFKIKSHGVSFWSHVIKVQISHERIWIGYKINSVNWQWRLISPKSIYINGRMCDNSYQLKTLFSLKKNIFPNMRYKFLLATVKNTWDKQNWILLWSTVIYVVQSS
jgi:hypothetical protein